VQFQERRLGGRLCGIRGSCRPSPGDRLPDQPIAAQQIDCGKRHVTGRDVDLVDGDSTSCSGDPFAPTTRSMLRASRSNWRVSCDWTHTTNTECRDAEREQGHAENGLQRSARNCATTRPTAVTRGAPAGSRARTLHECGRHGGDNQQWLRAVCANLEQQVQHTLCIVVVETRCRLVCQQQSGMVEQNRARAIATRCCSPRLSSAGLGPNAIARTELTRAAARQPARTAIPREWHAIATLSSALRLARRCSLTAARTTDAAAAPPIVAGLSSADLTVVAFQNNAADAGRRMPARTLSSVLFPDPLGPTTAAMLVFGRARSQASARQ